MGLVERSVGLVERSGVAPATLDPPAGPGERCRVGAGGGGGGGGLVSVGRVEKKKKKKDGKLDASLPCTDSPLRRKGTAEGGGRCIG